MNRPATPLVAGARLEPSATWRRVILALLMGMHCVTTASAQQVPPIVSGSWDVLPYSSIANPRPVPSEQNLDVLVNNPRLELNVPIRLGEASAMVNTLRYSRLDFDYRNALVLPEGTPDALHDLSYRATATTPLSASWRLLASAQLGLSSDFSNIESDHLRFQGALIFTRRLSDATSFGFGGAYRNDFGEPLLLPVANLQLRGNRFRADLQAPRHAAGFFQATHRLELGLSADVEGGYFRLGQAPNEGHQVKYSVISAGPAAQATLGPWTTLRVTAGAAFNRRFEVQDDTGSELRAIDLDRGLFIRFALELRPPGVGAPTESER